MSSISIGQLARSAQVGIDTVRYYEKHGLLPKPQRRASGYRQYTTADVRRLAFIRRAKALGFKLNDISELLKLRSGSDISRVRTVALQQLQVIETKIAELERIRTVLHQLVTSCPGHGDADHCPILRAFDDGVDQT